MSGDVLLLPHEARRADDVQGQLHRVQPSAIVSVRPVIGVVLDRHSYFRLARAVQHRERQRRGEGRRRREKRPVVSDDDARQNHQRLRVHLPVHARIELIILKILRRPRLTIRVKLSLPQIVLQVLHHVLVLAFPRVPPQRADPILLQRRPRALGMIRVEQRRALAPRLDVYHVPSRVSRHEPRHVVHAASHDHPAVVRARVPRHLRRRVRRLARVIARDARRRASSSRRRALSRAPRVVVDDLRDRRHRVASRPRSPRGVVDARRRRSRARGERDGARRGARVERARRARGVVWRRARAPTSPGGAVGRVWGSVTGCVYIE